MGDQGLLGIHKPEKFGGLGLDYSYEVAFCEALGAAKSGLGRDGDRRADRHGDARADQERLGRIARRISQAINHWRIRRLPRRVGSGRRLGRRLDQDDREEGRRRLRHQRRQDVDHQRHAGRLDVPARQHRRGPGPSQQDADLPADEDQGRRDRAQARQARHARLRHRADLLRQCARAAALPHRRGGHGLHLPDAAVPGGTASGPRPPA